MALVHNIILRGYNSIYLQAPHVKLADVHDFLRYSHAWYEFVIGHHDSEERILFPGIEEATGVKGIMDTDIEEHGRFVRNPYSFIYYLSAKKLLQAAFHDGLGNLKAYIDTCLATPSKYSGVELIKVLDSFGAALHSHLLHEPANLLALSKFSFDMKTLGDHTTQYGLQRYSTTDVLPVLWYNLDTKFEDGK